MLPSDEPDARSRIGTKKVLKITCFHFRNPNMTEEDYQGHWSEKHAKMAAPWLVRHGILKYAIVGFSS